MAIEDLLDKLLGYANAVMPWTVINQDELGLRYTLGKADKKDLSHGFHFYIPFIHEIYSFDATWGVIPVPICTIDIDNTTVSFEGSFLYKIVSARDYSLNLSDDDSEATLSEIGAGVYSEFVTENYEGIKTDRRAQLRKLSKRIQAEVNRKKFGVKVGSTYLSNFTKGSMVLRHIGSAPVVAGE